MHLVPAADPPHRPAPGATAAQRAQMLQLALSDYPGLQLDTRELQRAAHSDAPSHTVDTLRALRAELGSAAPIAWLLGADALSGWTIGMRGRRCSGWRTSWWPHDRVPH